MQEQEWTQGEYEDEAHNKKCIVGYLGPFDVWQTLYQAGHIADGSYQKLISINDSAKTFSEAKSKAINYLRGLGL